MSSVADSSFFQLVLLLKVYRPLQSLVNVSYRVLMCCTCHFQSNYLLFVYFASSVFKSLQCLICTLTQGSLVQLCCGEGGTLQTNISGICGECLQCLGHTRFAPTNGVCAFPVYTAQVQSCSAGELSKMAPGFCAFPRSKLLRFRFLGIPQRHRLGWVCILCPS